MPLPLLKSGCLADAAAAGEVLPQPLVVRGDGQQRLLDDELGCGAWLITRDAPPSTESWLRTVSLRRELSDNDALCRWLDRRRVECVLVRPDRYVFGTGEALRLRAAYARYLAGLG
jgi:3-(3-hydroxy-phenyl)propionate hydroxylase